jgi:cobalt-zinc-cadmium efflux system outer membrane protein
MYKFVLLFVVAVSWLDYAPAQSPGLPDIPARASAALSGSTATAAPLSLATALDLVLHRSPELSAAVREVGAQDGAVLQAGIAPNPELSGLVEDTQKATRTTTFQLNQPIELGGKRAARVTAAERGRDGAMAELAAKRSALRAASSDAFYDVLAAQERHRLAGESLDLAESALAAAAKRVLAGKNSPVDETRARIASSSARIDLAQARGEMVNARARLAALWGGTAKDFGRVEGRLDVIPDTPPLNILMDRLQLSPGLRRARIEVDRRQALTQVERARRLPDVTVSIGAKRDEQLGRNQAVFGLAVPLPFFDRNQGNLHEALQRGDKARDELTATEARLGSDLAQAHGQLGVAREQAQLLQGEILPGAQSAYDAARKGFDYGKFNFLDVIDAQRTLLQVKSQYLRALAEAHRAAADIERILGEPGPAVSGTPAALKP